MTRKLTRQEWFHRDGFPVAVERREPQGPFEPHSHEFSEVVLVTSGSGRHVTGQEDWPLVAGDVLVLSGRRAHTYTDLQNLCLINVLFQPDRLPFALSDLTALPGYHVLFTLEPAWRAKKGFRSRLRLDPAALAVALGHVERLEKELRDRSPGFAFHASAELMLLFGHLARCHERSPHPDSRSLLRIARAMSHLEQNFTRNVTVEDLAAIARLSRRSFLRAFESATGSPPIAYLIRLRVHHAASLLRHGNESVTEIAFRCGFSDSNYLARQFKTAFGVTPTGYRKRHGLAR